MLAASFRERLINVTVPVERINDWMLAIKKLGLSFVVSIAESLIADSGLNPSGYPNNDGPKLWFFPVEGHLLVTTEDMSLFFERTYQAWARALW